MAEALNPLTVPLQGCQLIEASAGTGKTWTIAALYLRLVTGHGGPVAPGQAGPRPLLPGEILVMTFTRAATRELRDRIRQRLVQAAACFRGESDASDDTCLQQLLQAFPAGARRQQAAWRLGLAAEAMDEAAVHTIDAWCQRMLREHAFDSGSLFDEELQADEAALRADALRDYWRQQVYPLSDGALAAVLAQWANLDTLAKQVQALIGPPLPPGAGQGSLAECLEHALQQRQQALATLKQGWVQRADEMLAWLEPFWQDKKHPVRKGLPAQAHGTRWLQALKDWAVDPEAVELDLGKAHERLSEDAIAQALRLDPAAPTAVPPAFAALDALPAAIAALPSVGTALRLHAAAGVSARLQQFKARNRSFGFADLLERLDTALDPAAAGERAERLRQRILAQYPVALVDEFQDTSPVQLRIFDRLYRIAEHDGARALLLIGDPKQAIYGFRGADIYSYLGAREATHGHHHVLGTNHRSTQALVAAVNRLFQAAEDRPGEGAFLFRAAGAASPLPFVPVTAQGRAQRLCTTAGELAPLTLVADPVLRNGDHNRRLFAALCAERIVTLLNDPQAGFAEAGKPFTRLRPADIAVLVRTGTEADAVRQALRQRGVASVYLSDKDSVLQSSEAADLLRLLQAVASPRDLRLARAALATPLLALTLDELLALSTDDAQFDRQCELLQQLQPVWQGQGVLSLVRRALHAFGLPARWLGMAGAQAGQGERTLTNVLHLAELLQAASATVEGEQALIRWLAQQIGDADAGGDEQVLRLESDADLVQVVTVHKSKGLEYPLVFVPFPALVRDTDSGADAVFLLPDGAGGQRLVVGPTPAEVELRRREDLRESLRLLYVALTRARHALWVGAAAPTRHQSYAWHRSALGCLLSGPAEQPPAQRLQDLRALGRAGDPVALQELPATEALPLPPVTGLQPRGQAPALLPAPAYTATFDRSWSIASYSALVRDAAWVPAAASGSVPTQVLRDDEPEDNAAGPAAALRPADAPWHRFPRGAFAGNFLHGLLEGLAHEGFALDDSAEQQQALLRRCQRQGWGHRADDVLAWLRRVCSTPLPPLGVALAGLGPVVPELEFWLPSDGLRASRLDTLCRQHLLPGRDRPQLPERALSGLLMGFADLVFEHQGRYWVLDHKSNALGARDADYTPATMEAAMLEHRYDVQAAIYLLALHRLLSHRLGGAYRPAQQLGGAIYLFLRGIHSAGAGCCSLAPPMALITELDALLPPGPRSPEAA